MLSDNRTFQSKFYGSDSRPVSYSELANYWSNITNTGDKLYVTIGMWSIKKALSMIVVTNHDKENRKTKYDLKHGEYLDNTIKKSNGELGDALVIFYRFLFNRFRKVVKDDLLTYIITSAYCNVALIGTNKINKVDCILYPSVQSVKEETNIAINPNFIKNENIELLDVMCNEMTVKGIENGKYSFLETNDWKAKKISIDSNKIYW